MHTEETPETIRRSARDGDTLVFVHGSGDSSQRWERVIARLQGFQCVALDLPGHGSLIGRPGPNDMSVADYTDAVRRELARRELTHVCLVGHSLGSAITLTMALTWPALVGRIVLIGAGARLRVIPNLLAGARTDPDATMRALVELGHAPGHERQAEQGIAALQPVASGMLYRDLAACDGFDVMNDLGRVSQPALIITGAHDRLTPPKYAEFLSQRLPNAKLVAIPDAGHYVMDEAPDAVAAAITAWLAGTGYIEPKT